MGLLQTDGPFFLLKISRGCGGWPPPERFGKAKAQSLYVIFMIMQVVEPVA